MSFRGFFYASAGGADSLATGVFFDRSEAQRSEP
jgi:hypothetical protein